MSPRRPYAYVAVGLVGGLAYAFLNTQTDDWARTDWARAEFARGFFAFHAFVDRGIPVLAGALFGLAVHWLYLRSRLAQELRSRLNHVERDQAVWVVAASTLHELKNPLHAMGLLVDELGEISQGGDPAAIEAQVARVRVQMDRALLPRTYASKIRRIVAASASSITRSPVDSVPSGRRWRSSAKP